MPTTWDTEHLELLKELYTAGEPLGRIALRLGTTKGAIKMAASRNGWKRPPPGTTRPPRRPREPDLDISRRLAILLGQEVRGPAPRRDFSDSQLLRFAGQGAPDEALTGLRDRAWPWIAPHNPLAPQSAVLARLAGLEAYTREVVGLELMDHQLAEAYCCLAGKRVLVLAGRQSGKDVCISALALWEALTAPNSRIVMCSGSQRQSDALMEKVLGYIARSQETFDAVASSSREALTFRNGSFIKALPATGMIRGETATRVLVNEARDVLNEDETYSALEPMLLTTGGSFCIFTTPLGKTGRVWEAFNSPLYLKVQVPSTASKYATPEHLERQRLEMSAPMYQNEYEAQFLDIQSSYFSPESIADAVQDYSLAEVREEGKRYSLGIDWARTRDTSAMVVVSVDDDDHLKVEWMHGWLGLPMPEQLAHVRRLEAVFHFSRIVSEYAGLGIGPSDQLREEDLDVDLFKPTAEQKALGFDALKQRFERRTITIPSDPKLLMELRTLEFKLTPAGNLTIHGAGSDDFAHALMMAVWPWRHEAGFEEPRDASELLRAFREGAGGVPGVGGGVPGVDMPGYGLAPGLLICPRCKTKGVVKRCLSASGLEAHIAEAHGGEGP